jgi:Flp pilus assembly protein TadB
MYVIFVLAIILIACLFFLLDRALKAIQRGRRRRNASERLVAAAIAAEEQHRRREQQHRQHKAQQAASTALTNVLPAIRSEDDGPRRVA